MCEIFVQSLKIYIYIYIVKYIMIPTMILIMVKIIKQQKNKKLLNTFASYIIHPV